MPTAHRAIGRRPNRKNDMGRKLPRGATGPVPAQFHRRHCPGGWGHSTHAGPAHAEGQFPIIQNGDLEYDPQDYPRLIEPLLSGESQVVYGSRYLSAQGKPRQHWSLFRCGVAALNVCVRLLYGARLTDEATCYKAFPTDLLRAMDLECERFEFCPEVTAKACRLGLRIHEVPVRYDARSVQAGKKIRWTDGLEALAALWRWRDWRPGPSAAKSRRAAVRRGRPGRRPAG